VRSSKIRLQSQARLVIALCTLWPVGAGAQFGRDPAVNDVISAYHAGEFERAAVLVAGLPRGLSRRDQAVAAIYEGLLQLVRGEDAAVAFQSAALLDPTVSPDPSQHGPSRLETYQAVRRGQPIFSTVSVQPASFHPYLDVGPPTITFAMEQPPAPGVRRSLERIEIIAVGPQGDSARLGTVSEGARVTWDPWARARDAVGGNYVLVLRGEPWGARGIRPEIAVPLKVELDAPHGTDIGARPPIPVVLPESTTAQVPDPAKKGRRTVGGVITTLLGAGLAVGAYQYSTNVAIDTPEGSAERIGAAVGYAAGAAVGLVGIILTISALSGDYTKEETIPLPENIAENARRGVAYDQQAKDHAERTKQVRETVTVRFTLTGRP
jgi:hypothetical protein